MLLQLLLIPPPLELLKLLLQVLLLLLFILLLLELLILLPQVLLLPLARSSVPPSAPLVPSPAHASIVTTRHPTFAAVNRRSTPGRSTQQFLRSSADAVAPQIS